MKKIFSFLVLFLLSSYMATNVVAQDPPYPVKFSSTDGVDFYEYNICVKRAGTYWTLDHSVSSTVIHQTPLPEDADQIQRWRFVLVEKSTDVFYIQNSQTGEYVHFLPKAKDKGEASLAFVDTYGKTVPLESFSDKDDYDAYYADLYGNNDALASTFKLEYRSDLGGWVLMDQSGSSVNARWERDGASFCKYGPDAGNVMVFMSAGIPFIEPSVSSLTIGSLAGKKTQGYLTVAGRSLPEAISVAIEGKDAANFTFKLENENPSASEFRAGTVVVDFTPSELRDTPYEATLKFTSGEGEATVDLIGNVYPDSDLPKISEDGGEDFWYYIQSKIDIEKGNGETWTATGSNERIIRQAITPGSFDDMQLWKIVGDWETGFFFVNKGTNYELRYNQNLDGTPEHATITYPGADAGGSDVFFSADGVGNGFSFVKDANGDWQLYNRDMNSAPVGSTRSINGYNARLVYARPADANHPLVLRQAGVNPERTQIVFTEVAARIIPPLKTNYSLIAKAGETSGEVDIAITGVGLGGNISAQMTNNDVFSLSTAALPAEGGTLTVYYDPKSDDVFYADTLTLSAPGAADVVITFIGSSGKPVFSLENDSWHYIQFSRRAGDNKVWQANGIGTAAANKISQKVRVEGDHNQHWRFVGTESNMIIQNRATGGYFTFVGSESPKVEDPDAVLTDNEKDATALAIVRDEEKDTWAIKDIAKNNGLNDRSTNYVCHYNITDGGSLFNFFPAEYEAVGRKLIVSDKAAVLLKAEAPKESTATINISSIGVENTISVAVSGDGFDVSPKTLPAEGGELTISFTQTEANKEFTGSLTISSVGAEKDVEVSLTGITAPAFSDDLSGDIWYYIQFERSVTKNTVWQGNGVGNNVTQEPYVLEEESQHWKLVGTWNDKFAVANRKGGEVALLGKDGDGKAEGFATLAEAGLGSLLTFVPDAKKWSIWLHEYAELADRWGCLNDYDGKGTDIGVYYIEDAGDYVNFIPVEGGNSINNPGIDPNDLEVGRKYYTLQGMEVKVPTTTGIYIVKKLYESGKTQAVKEIITVK